MLLVLKIFTLGSCCWWLKQSFDEESKKKAGGFGTVSGFFLFFVFCFCFFFFLGGGILSYWHLMARWQVPFRLYLSTLFHLLWGHFWGQITTFPEENKKWAKGQDFCGFSKLGKQLPRETSQSNSWIQTLDLHSDPRWWWPMGQGCTVDLLSAVSCRRLT